MPATHHLLHTPALTVAWMALAGAARGLQRRLRQALQDGRRRRQARRAERLLMSLDDRTLRDLGVSRAEVPSLAHDPQDATRARHVRTA